MEVYLDLDAKSDLSDEELVDLLVSRFKLNYKEIADRIKKIAPLGISYDTKSVRLYHQAEELFELGYFESTIMVCRATAEHLATELFFEQADISGNEETIAKIAETLDFRKIVNDVLHDKKNPNSVIKSDMCQLFNDLYKLGNDYIHPRTQAKERKPAKDAETALKMTKKLIDGYRNVMDDYDVSQGKLKPKATARSYKRGIKLGS